MKIARFIYNKKICYGMVENRSASLIDGSIFDKFKITKKKIDISKITLLPPVNPGKVICVGLNYKDHAKELNMPIPDEAIIFIKPPTSITGHNQKITYPECVKRLDYEAELAVIIKKEAKNIDKEDAKDYILGYTCLNDVTARDIQKKDIQWTRAKSFDTFCPIGPFIVTDIKPDNLSIKLYLNGKIKQSSTTANLIFKIDKLVSFISNVMTLKPGDVIATGTPPGVGPMNINDKVEVKIEKIGTLANTVASI
ncbi:MAG: fumarylacetoacetate hydrolase family protein [Candidatus Omnitrophota bacterium]|nr:MAG: fumarylacetoacetate hydrolase family protein [Candidatus Omnitrophota bacterium]